MTRSLPRAAAAAPAVAPSAARDAPRRIAVRRAPLLALAGAALLLGLAGLAPAAALAQADDPEDPHVLGAALYCAQSGGNVRSRYPAYGTNDATPVRLAGERRFCEFQAPDDSRIAVALDTLYATAPSLAALAYLTPPPLGNVPPGVNPSSVYCTQLGGTDEFGGRSAAGGGWVLQSPEASAPAAAPAPAPAAAGADVIAMCVFPDLSSIDSWGLTYHADGTVRGADLAPILRYQLPAR
jgi:putative hemolysin